MPTDAGEDEDAGDVVVLYNSFFPCSYKCGHWAVLSDMVQQLHDNSKKANGLMCPICNEPVLFVVDKRTIYSKDAKTINAPTVTFKFGKVSFRLGVMKQPDCATAKSWWQEGFLHSSPQSTTAQYRIARGLQLDLRGLKIISAGRMVFSCASSEHAGIIPKAYSNESISERLLDDSVGDDSVHQLKTPRWIVMGTPTWLVPMDQTQLQTATRTSFVKWGLQMMWKIGKTILCLIVLGRTPTSTSSDG